MLTPDRLRAAHERGLPYDDYVRTGTPANRQAWADFHGRCALSDQQRSLLAGFVREINVIALSGTWCGDCVQQVPFLARFEEANPGRVRLRLLDRDAEPELADELRICSGTRVPVVVFANEDFDFISLFGDRSLTRYRAMAARQLGAACPLPGAPVDADERQATQQDWLDELERVHILCRLSPKLRARHSD